MKRPIFTAVLATVTLLTAEAQSVTYNHDDAVMNQVTVQETGSGSLTPDLYYDVFHKSYRNSASETNKLSYRTMTAAYMKLQEPYSEKIDSDLVKRAKVEAANLLDREVDAVWLVEVDVLGARVLAEKAAVTAVQTDDTVTVGKERLRDRHDDSVHTRSRAASAEDNDGIFHDCIRVCSLFSQIMQI